MLAFCIAVTGGRWRYVWGSSASSNLVMTGVLNLHLRRISRVPAHHTILLLFLALAHKSSSGRGGESSKATSAGMQEEEGAKPPAKQLKITKYFPNIIRFPCKQLSQLPEGRGAVRGEPAWALLVLLLLRLVFCDPVQ